MFASGFSMNVGKIAEDESRQTETFVCHDIAKQYGIYLVGGLATKALTAADKTKRSLPIRPAKRSPLPRFTPTPRQRKRPLPRRRSDRTLPMRRRAARRRSSATTCGLPEALPRPAMQRGAFRS
jgi:hypothetical protein